MITLRCMVLAFCGLLVHNIHAQDVLDPSEVIAGSVIETMEGGRYTYMLIDTGNFQAWVACSQMDVAVGDEVTVQGGTSMSNFQSPSLNRTFDKILFTEGVLVGSRASSPMAELPPGHPPVSSMRGHGAMHDGEMGPGITGEIIEFIDAGNYTYLRVKASDQTIWAATERMSANIGDHVTVPVSMLMKNFESPTLGRTFDEIYFADKVELVDSSAAYSVADHNPISAESKSEQIVRPEGGLSIAEIYAQRKQLEGSEVIVRGKVVKYTEQVMGSNWIHLMDGTEAADNKDLTVSTKDFTQMGNVITIKGRVVLDEDLGHNYKYPVLIKDAILLPEPVE